MTIKNGYRISLIDYETDTGENNIVREWDTHSYYVAGLAFTDLCQDALKEEIEQGHHFEVSIYPGEWDTETKSFTGYGADYVAYFEIGKELDE